MSLPPDSRFSPILESKGFSSSAELILSEGVLCARFTAAGDTHTLQYRLPEPSKSLGVNTHIRLRGWENVRYVAVGYMEGKNFRHIKAPNIRIGGWVDFGFTHKDLIWQIQNGSSFDESCAFDNIRLFVKGTPSADGATLEISGMDFFSFYNCAIEKNEQSISAPLLGSVYDFLKNNFRNYHSDAEVLLTSSTCPMPGGARLNWPLDSSKPCGLEAVSTYRFAWHAQHPVISLLLYAHGNHHAGAILMCRTLVEEWLRVSYDVPDSDVKFTWYDHGTAERLLAFVLLWAVGQTWGGDERFQARLGNAIVQHARLLASEAFYAYHQPLRYHNHAWFQDAALLTTALAFPGLQESCRWRDVAISRFEDQLEHLIVRDGRFAIFVENSIGYHHGVQKLALWMGRLVGLSGVASDVPEISKQLVMWSDFFRYPDGRTPAQGDTFRKSPQLQLPTVPSKPWEQPECLVLPKAGYFVVKGNHLGRPFLLSMLATCLNKTHKHEDNLALTLWFDEVEWLIDPSFYSHDHNDPVSSYLRSARAHNAPFIEGLKYSKELGVATISLERGGPSYVCKGSHQAYADFIVSRVLAGSTECMDLTCVDDISGLQASKADNGTLSFHFGEGVTLAEISGGYQLSHPGSNSMLALLVDNKRARILTGQQEGQEFKSVAGHGFLQYVDTVSLEVDFMIGEPLKWRLIAMDDRGLLV